MRLVSDSKYKVHVNPVVQGGGKYTYYEVSWTFDSQTERRTFKVEREAEEFAQTVRDMLEHGRPEVVMAKPSAVMMFSMVYSRIGEDRLMEVLRAELARTVAVITPRDAAQDYLGSIRHRGLSKRHQATAKSNLERFIASVKKQMHTIDKYDIDHYLHQFDNLKTRLNHRTTLCSFFAFARRKGWIADRATAADLSERPKFKVTEPEILHPDQMLAMIGDLLAQGDEKAVVHLVLGGFCGARSAEIQRLRWGNVKLETGSLEFPTDVTKTQRRRVCRLEPNALAWLSALKPADAKANDPVTWTENNLNERLRAMRVRLQMPLVQNGLRHSYASYHLELYANASLTAKNCGHSIQLLERHYMQITDRQTAEQWFKIFPAEKPTSEQQSSEPAPFVGELDLVPQTNPDCTSTEPVNKDPESATLVN